MYPKINYVTWLIWTRPKMVLYLPVLVDHGKFDNFRPYYNHTSTVKWGVFSRWSFCPNPAWPDGMGQNRWFMIFGDRFITLKQVLTLKQTLLSPTSMCSVCCSSLEWSRMTILQFEIKITWASFYIDLIIQMNFLMVFLCVQFLNCSSKLKYNFILWIISYDL